MKSERALRALIINRMKSGLSETNARTLVSAIYPEQIGDIWTLELVVDSPVSKEEIKIDYSIDSDVVDDPTEDLDVSMLTDSDDTDDEISVVETTKIKNVEQTPAKRTYNTKKKKMREIVSSSEDKSIGHITIQFIRYFDMTLAEAYAKALITISDFEKGRFS